MERQLARRWGISLIVAAIGVWWQFYSLSLIERSVSIFPSVHDVLLESLPLVNFGFWGEVLFFALILVFAVSHFRSNWRRTPEVLIALGIFYFVRGWFMYLFPIGAPFGAIDPSLRLNLWGHATHAYFPGGHIGVLSVLTMMIPSRRLRFWMWWGVALFGVGTLLAKNHYTMDSVAGVLLGIGVVAWVRSRLRSRP